MNVNTNVRLSDQSFTNDTTPRTMSDVVSIALMTDRTNAHEKLFKCLLVCHGHGSQLTFYNSCHGSNEHFVKLNIKIKC